MSTALPRIDSPARPQGAGASRHAARLRLPASPMRPWDSVAEGDWPAGQMTAVATLRDPTLDEPTFLEFHPEGTRYESAQCPGRIAIFSVQPLRRLALQALRSALAALHRVWRLLHRSPFAPPRRRTGGGSAAALNGSAAIWTRSVHRALPRWQAHAFILRWQNMQAVISNREDFDAMKVSERNFTRRIDLTSLQLFVAVCELGSIGAPAEREFIAPRPSASACPTWKPPWTRRCSTGTPAAST